MKKKVLALVMAAAMTFGTMGMSTVAFAADDTLVSTDITTPAEADHQIITVKNVDSNMTVTAYQIVDAKYDTHKGFVGYKATVSGIADPLNITSAEITALVKAGTLTGGTQLTETGEGTGVYTADLTVGTYLILVTPSDNAAANVKVYNPMLASVFYTNNGKMAVNSVEGVDANGQWSVKADSVTWAKSSDVPFTKTAYKVEGETVTETEAQSVNIGDTVNYKLDFTIPEYSEAYKDDEITFEITDTMTGQEFQTGTLSVTIDGAPVDAAMYQAVMTETNLVITFEDGQWLKTNKNKNVIVSYNTTIANDALVNNNANKNDAKLEYTNAPGKTTTVGDMEKVYTFDIDGNVLTDEILQKVGGTTTDNAEPLPGAEFTLYKEDKTTMYTNSVFDGKVTSDDNGKLFINGLEEGTYYLKETDAPDGYSLNTMGYTIVIDATYDGEELADWTITVTDDAGNTKDNTFTVTNGVAEADTNNQMTQIMNTTMSTLPSTGGIGTTIFTIGGCVIMIAAAGIFFVSRKKENEAK